MHAQAPEKSGKASPELRLRQTADSASRIRALATHPAVIALRVETVQRQVDCLMWLGILLGLAFTMANVQAFAAAGAPAWSLAWLTAWLLDPMVSVVLIAVLLAEQVFSRYQVAIETPWIRRTKVFTFVATLVMNTWEPVTRADVAGLVLHSVPPLLVYCAAETAPHLRDRLTEAVNQAERAATGHVGQVVNTWQGPAGAQADRFEKSCNKHKPKPTRWSADASTSPKTVPSRRKLLADFVAEASAAWHPGIEMTPTWVREVTGCSAGLTRKVIQALHSQDGPVRPVHRTADGNDHPNATLTGD